jgi:uncharacterized membrane protein YeaQ/YmgE (transglycosylase-associated protein family)
LQDNVSRHSTSEEDKMMYNLLVFGLIGLVAGAAARTFYPERQPLRVLGTMALGVAGALGGGLLSWSYWPEVDGQFSSGSLLVSFLGAVLVIAFSASLAYARRLST